MRKTVQRTRTERKTGTRQRPPARKPIALQLTAADSVRLAAAAQRACITPQNFARVMAFQGMREIEAEGRVTLTNLDVARADHARPSPLALWLLWEILNRHIFKFPELTDVASEAESLLELIRHNPGLKPEVKALSELIRVEARLRQLHEEAEAASND